MAITSPVFYVDATGIHAPTYDEILEYYQNKFLGIYGSDAYIAPDSQDGQMLAIFASATHDANQAAVADFNSFSPTYAQGTKLSSLVKINGLARLVATRSAATVTVGGVAGTVITGGIAQDDDGNKWDLPAVVTIPLSGTIDVTATAQEAGATTALPGAISTIYNPTRGWQTVSNAAAASAGNPVESDADLRRRQAISTAVPAQAIVESIEAAVGNIPGVSRFKVYENATDSTDSDGVPAHSICVVTDGGDHDAIAAAIASRKPPGIQTYGDVSVDVVDAYGIPRQINFFDLVEVPLTITITVRALPGWLTSTGTSMKQAVAAFVNAYEVGEDSFASRLYSPAGLNGDAATEATGMTQAQLDALGRTFNILAVAQSRASNPPTTTVSGGPYLAASTSAAVADAGSLYAGQRVRFVLDNAAFHDVVVSNVAGSSVAFLGYPVPALRNIPTGSSVYLLSDVAVGFKEAATAAVADITVTVAS